MVLDEIIIELTITIIIVKYLTIHSITCIQEKYQNNQVQI